MITINILQVLHTFTQYYIYTVNNVQYYNIECCLNDVIDVYTICNVQIIYCKHNNTCTVCIRDCFMCEVAF